jgi:hypothetical protein
MKNPNRSASASPGQRCCLGVGVEFDRHIGLLHLYFRHMHIARTLPDAVSTYQEWLSEWLAMCNEDSRRFLSDGQKIVATGVRCFTNISPRATS